MDFPAAYALTLLIEVPALLIMLRKRYPPLLIACGGIIASGLTLPLVWFFFPALGIGWAGATIAAELFAGAAETVIYLRLFPGIGWKGAASASVICNAMSFIAGLLMH
ncbi:MAG: hypothetical protein U0R44_05020 [Candidatus Micrarchaeia archaeon]